MTEGADFVKTACRIPGTYRHKKRKAFRLPLIGSYTDRLFFLFLYFDLADCFIFDFFFDCCNEFSEVFHSLITKVTDSYGNLALFLFFCTNYKHVRYSFQTCFTDLVAHLFGTSVNGAADACFFHLCFYGTDENLR